MAYYPQSASGLGYAMYPASGVATVSASASANTKGSYTELTSSSDFECNLLEVYMLATNSGGRRYLFDLATGAGGAETIVVPNMLVDAPSSAGQSGQGMYTLPLTIGISTRIAARCQSSTGNSQMFMSIHLVAAGEVDGPSSYVNYGAATADSGGTAVDPGAVASTKGSYVELSASTSAIIQVFAVMFATNGNTGPSDQTGRLDLATGAGGAETVLIPDMMYTTINTQNPTPPRSRTRLTYIAASTRLAVRASSGITDATDRVIDVALVAATAPSESGSGSGAASYVFVG